MIGSARRARCASSSSATTGAALSDEAITKIYRIDGEGPSSDLGEQETREYEPLDGSSLRERIPAVAHAGAGGASNFGAEPAPASPAPSQPGTMEWSRDSSPGGPVHQTPPPRHSPITPAPQPSPAAVGPPGRAPEPASPASADATTSAQIPPPHPAPSSGEGSSRKLLALVVVMLGLFGALAFLALKPDASTDPAEAVASEHGRDDGAEGAPTSQHQKTAPEASEGGETSTSPDEPPSPEQGDPEPRDAPEPEGGPDEGDPDEGDVENEDAASAAPKRSPEPSARERSEPKKAAPTPKSREPKLPARVSLKITSTPPKADVKINDELVGQTPLTHSVRRGDEAVMVSVSRFGYEASARPVTPDKDRKLRFKLNKARLKLR